MIDQIAAIIDRAAFDLQREDRAIWGTLARNASKRRRIAIANAEKIMAIITRPTEDHPK
jgi:hypothetical protein